MKDPHQFATEWTGKYFPAEPGFAGHQCVVADKTFERESGWNPVTHGNAIDYMKGETGYTVIWNTPQGIPKPGDIGVVQVGADGHTGIVISADINHVQLFGQNYPIGQPAKTTTFGYETPGNRNNKIIGWLRHNG